MQRISSAKQALDYPTGVDDDAVVIWAGNEFLWPDARRSTVFLSAERADIMKGYALMTSYVTEARSFPDTDQARVWLAEQEEKRGRPYHDIQVTTVAEMKIARGYEPRPEPAQDLPEP